jgi:hypothetical protein
MNVRVPHSVSYRVMLVLLSGLLVIMAGCTALPPAVPGDAETEASPEATMVPMATAPEAGADLLADCPSPEAGMQRLINFEHGYCLTYPAEYKVEKPNESETLLVIGGLLNASDPRVHIHVEPAAGRTAEAAAAQIVADNADFDIAQSEAQIAGQPAVVLDKLPGQDINRRVYLVAQDRLYSFYFAPADPAVEAFAGTESLYMEILNSFTLLPELGELSVDRAVLDCLDVTRDTIALVDEDRGFCLFYPDDYQFAEPGENEVVLYAGSLMDVSRPKVFIRVEDAAGRTAAQVADAIVAEFDAGVERIFGVTIGYEVAERLDNVPGQDLSRQVIAAHGDRVYTLAFVPADETQGDVYREMEALYDLVLRSFRFVN